MYYTKKYKRETWIQISGYLIDSKDLLLDSKWNTILHFFIFTMSYLKITILLLLGKNLFILHSIFLEMTTNQEQTYSLQEDISEIIHHYKQSRTIDSLYHTLKQISPEPLFSTLTQHELRDFLLKKEYVYPHSLHLLRTQKKDEQDDLPSGIQTFYTRPQPK
jgi:hypothetical protein